MISHKHFTKNVKHHDFLHTYPGVVTVGDGLLDLISSRVAFLLIGRVVGVANTSESLFEAGTCNLEAGVVSILAADLGFGVGISLFTFGVMRIGFLAEAPMFSKLSSGGGLDFVGLGRTLFGLFGPSLRPPPMGLFKMVPKADSLSNSHLMIVSLTEREKNMTIFSIL